MSKKNLNSGKNIKAVKANVVSAADAAKKDAAKKAMENAILSYEHYLDWTISNELEQMLQRLKEVQSNYKEQGMRVIETQSWKEAVKAIAEAAADLSSWDEEIKVAEGYWQAFESYFRS